MIDDYEHESLRPAEPVLPMVEEPTTNELICEAEERPEQFRHKAFQNLLRFNPELYIAAMGFSHAVGAETDKEIQIVSRVLGFAHEALLRQAAG